VSPRRDGNISIRFQTEIQGAARFRPRGVSKLKCPVFVAHDYDDRNADAIRRTYAEVTGKISDGSIRSVCGDPLGDQGLKFLACIPSSMPPAKDFLRKELKG
jgi:hypothetical protein